MGIKEQSFKSKHMCPRATNTKEHMKLLEIDRQPVNDSKLLLDMIVHWPILHIDVSEIIHEFWLVSCPLMECVMQDSFGHVVDVWTWVIEWLFMKFIVHVI